MYIIIVFGSESRYEIFKGDTRVGFSLVFQFLKFFVGGAEGKRISDGGIKRTTGFRSRFGTDGSYTGKNNF